MVYLIVILAIGLVLGPLMAAMPTKRQREVASLRERASAQGLRVSLKSPPEIPPRFKFSCDIPLTIYSGMIPKARKSSVQQGLYVHTSEGWQAKAVGEQAPALLAELPVSAPIVFIGWDEVQVFWSERGGEPELDRIISVIHGLTGQQDWANSDQGLTQQT